MKTSHTRHKTLLIILSITLSLSAFAQSKTDDISLIIETVTNYYDGYIERDIAQLYKAFDTENGTMKIPLDTNDSTKGFKNVFFKDVVPKWGNREKLSNTELENCALHILNIDIEAGQIASAKMSMKVGDVTYIDILSLNLINGDWKITNKIYHVK
ncbi:nuclear transport factor 2 family protein [Psychroserpens sp.]|uniref:nuclear transport factor 2 family protein n=1 Tax=Psychroserpens sp. TaxID=2020870 RepID=UPI0039E2FA22